MSDIKWCEENCEFDPDGMIFHDARCVFNSRSQGQHLPEKPCKYCDNYKKAYFKLSQKIKDYEKLIDSCKKTFEYIRYDNTDIPHPDFGSTSKMIRERKQSIAGEALIFGVLCQDQIKQIDLTLKKHQGEKP